MLALSGLAALAAMAWFATRLSYDAARDQARRHVASAAGASSIAVEQEVQGLVDVVASIASRPTLRGAIGSVDPTDHQLALIHGHLEELKAIRPVFSFVAVTDVRGTLIDVMPATPSILGNQFSFRDWYRGAVATGRPYVSEAFRTRVKPLDLVVGISSPIRATADPRSAIVGVLVAGYRLASVQEFVNEFAGPQGVALTLVDQQGMEIAARGTASTELISRLGDPAVVAALAGDSGTSIVGGSILAHSPIPEFGWALLAEAQSSVVLSEWPRIRAGVLGAAATFGMMLLAGLALLDRPLRRRAKVAAELRRSKAFVDSVLDNIPSTVFVKDARDLRYVRINQAGEDWLELFGHERGASIGHDDAELFGPDVAAGFAAKDRAALGDDRQTDAPIERMDFPSGETLLMRTWRIPIMGPQGRPEYLVGISHDVTEQQHAEAQEARRRSADDSNRAKSEFLSRMSHELRTPLNAVLGFSQLMLLGELTPLQRANVDHIAKAGHHLLQLIDQVLDISRVESGELRLSLEAVPLDEVITEALGMVGPMATSRGLRIVDQTPLGADHHVRADRQRLRQVLVNLLSNAVKYNRDQGQVAIGCEPAAGGRWRITVADTGIGIAAADLPRLFLPFERLGAANTTVEGTGLGLAISKQLVEAMGGQIGVTSSVGEGSSFWVELPMQDAPRHGPVADSSTAQLLPPATGASGGRTVLYIEDNISNIKLVEQIAASAGVTLMAAMQGGLGVELALEHRPSLILLDLGLPDIPGEVVLRRLRADQRTASTPIVVLSADATPGQVERLLALGATDYLTKPFEIPRLLGLIDRCAAVDIDGSPEPMPRAVTGRGTLDPFVVASLHELAGDSDDGLAQLSEMVGVYLTDAGTRLDDLAAAARSTDVDRIAAVAHSLGGSSANYGARIVAAQCLDLERMARTGEVARAPELVAQLRASFAEARSALQREFLRPGELVAP